MLANNPPFVILDTSVLLQLLVTGHLSLLRRLLPAFQVQAAIVPAVETEVINNMSYVPKFRGLDLQFRKALGNGALAVVNHELLRTRLATGADSWIRQIDLEGERLSLTIDRGEAYSHAASSVLGVPIATNDMSAVNHLLRKNETIPRPIIRFWDLLVLGRQCDMLDDQTCDRTRKKLQEIGERTHHCFAKAAFVDGLPNFFARLLHANLPPIGASEPQDRFDERLLLQPITENAATASPNEN